MPSRFLRLGVTGVLAAALVSSPVFSQGNSQGHGKGKGHNKRQDRDDQGESAKYYFRERDREIITRYYSNRGSNLPPGLAKRGGNLPPGLERQLERNGTLPPCHTGRAGDPGSLGMAPGGVTSGPLQSKRSARVWLRREASA